MSIQGADSSLDATGAAATEVSVQEMGLQEALVRLGVTDLAEAGAEIGNDAAARALVLRLAERVPAGGRSRDAEPDGDRVGASIALEYLDISASALSRANATADELSESATVLTDIAAMVRAVPNSMRPTMQGPVNNVVKQTAVLHYERIVRALNETGAMEALEAEGWFALRHLTSTWLPPLDANLLQRAGHQDVQQALAVAITQARGVPDRLTPSRGLDVAMQEGRSVLAEGLPVDPPGLPIRRSKRWTGVGKILTGAALAGGNVAGAALLGVGTAGASLGATWLGVVGSTGIGVGMVFEGVGAIRGE